MLADTLDAAGGVQALWTVPTIALAVTCCLAVPVVVRHMNLYTCRTGEVPVEWSWMPVLGSVIEFGRNPRLFLSKCRQRSEVRGVFGIVLGGQRMFFLTDPRAYGLLFKADKTKVSFDPIATGAMVNAFGSSLCPITGNNPALKAGSFSASVRNQYHQHLLNDHGLAIFTTRMQRKMNALARSMVRTTQTVNLKDFIYGFAMKAAVAGVFNEALADDPRVQQSLFEFDSQFLPLLGGAPSILFPAARAARSLLQTLMLYSFEDSCPLMQSRQQLMQEHLLTDHDIGCTQTSFLWASAANTMPTSYWVFYHLLTDSVAMGAVQQELADVFGCRAPSGSFDLNDDDLSKLKILDSCISEALRMHGAPLITREVLESGYEFRMPSGESFRFRKGDRLLIYPQFLHFDAEIFPNPECFKFDRFIDPPSSYRKDGYEVPFGMALMPFGGGATYCPGRKFARNEIKTIAAYLLANFSMSIIRPTEGESTNDDVNIGRTGAGTLPPLVGAMVSITPKFA